MLQIINITPNIPMLVFDKQVQLTSSLVRIQEHYESPHFAGQYFSMKEFVTWYTQHSPGGKITGRFTYFTDWPGFNFPSRILKPFKDGHFNPLTHREVRVLQALQEYPEPFYVVAVARFEDDIDSLIIHEVAHAFFDLYPDYRESVLKVVRGFDSSQIKIELRGDGYGPATLEDEVHAYGLDGDGSLCCNFPRRVTRELNRIFTEQVQKIGAHIPSYNCKTREFIP
ncbi:MAG: hypothetical protein WCO56_28390 [Verrucomicrobiota bacterium]